MKLPDKDGHFHSCSQIRVNAELVSVVDDELPVSVCFVLMVSVSASDGEDSAVARQDGIALSDDWCAVLCVVIVGQCHGVESGSDALNFILAGFIVALSNLPVLRVILILGEIIVVRGDEVIAVDELEEGIVLIVSRVSGNDGLSARKLIVRVGSVVESLRQERFAEPMYSAVNLFDAAFDVKNLGLVIDGLPFAL